MSFLSALESCETVYTDCPSGCRLFSFIRHDEGENGIMPVLVLLHGFPQNSLMYKNFIGEIPEKWHLLIPDLPGYGKSSKPISEDSRAHSKREMARDILHCVDSVFGGERPIIALGHDRGARVAYRLALDEPERVVGVAVLDIVPTAFVWDAMRIEKDHAETKRSHHWITLSAPRPLPERMIASNTRFYYEYTITSWCKEPADEEWVQDSIAPYLDEEGGARIAAACEDYRAGATHDVDDDFKSVVHPLTATPAKMPFKCPLLVLSSHHLRRRFDVDRIWENVGEPGKVQSYQIGDASTGHFIVNEHPQETGERLRAWLSEWFESDTSKTE